MRRPFCLQSAGGDYMNEATVTEWLRSPGDLVSAGEPVVVIETAKVSIELTPDIDGMLIEIVAGVGQDVAIGGLLGFIDDGTPEPAA